MVKNNLNANFENLKAEMMKKKEVAKDVESVNVNEIKTVNKNVNESEYIDKNIVKNTDVNLDTANENLQTTNISQNKIVIKKAQKVQPPKRITYYLNQDTIKKIEKYSKLTGMGKSEFVQTLLDVSLNNLEIE